ncbi:MAG: 6,7-dimethyl-8-ribityllumazine synthase [bacterium]
MVKIIEGQLDAHDIKFGLIVSRFNDFITGQLLKGALDALLRHGSSENNITVVRVPGCFEVPYAASKMAQSKKYESIICLGALIRGQTPHFNYISSEVSKGIAKIALDTGVPVIYGIITCENIEQAIERAGTKAGNKGWDAAIAGIEMVNVFKKI